MIEDYGLQIRKAAIALQNSGLQARIPNSSDLYWSAKAAHSLNQYDADLEYHWRAASLVYGAMLAARGKWSETVRAYSSKDCARGAEGAITPLPRTHCVALAAMMAIGEAFARVRSEGYYAEEAASEAVRWLAMLNDSNYNAWHGVALVVIAQAQQNKNVDCTDLAVYARSLLSPSKQPELCILADHLAGEGDGTVRHRRFRKRPATLQAAECLYLFNAPL